MACRLTVSVGRKVSSGKPSVMPSATSHSISPQNGWVGGHVGELAAGAGRVLAVGRPGEAVEERGHALAAHRACAAGRCRRGSRP